MKEKNSAKSKHPSESLIIQIGVAVIVVSGFAILAYSLQRFIP